MNARFNIKWVDGGREPQVKPNPAYPTGKDVGEEFVKAFGIEGTCKADLPYPAKRCGHYEVECLICGTRVGCTTAGRPDDPRSIRFPCKMMAGSA